MYFNTLQMGGEGFLEKLCVSQNFSSISFSFPSFSLVLVSHFKKLKNLGPPPFLQRTPKGGVGLSTAVHLFNRRMSWIFQMKKDERSILIFRNQYNFIYIYSVTFKTIHNNIINVSS